ncbi:MAG: hypothetical protein ACLQE9_19180 [Roseiarcus sp.]
MCPTRRFCYWSRWPKTGRAISLENSTKTSPFDGGES